MGPTTLFDKSFLQSLSVDESVWFDNFFLANVSPLFYIETLADLQKGDLSSSEDEVRKIADKFPQINGAPCAFHVLLARANLFGQYLPMNGQIPLVGGRPARTANLSGIVFEQSPEVEAFGRWQRGQFRDVERLTAREWRDALTGIDLNAMASMVRRFGVSGRTVRSETEAHTLARRIITEKDGAANAIRLACAFLNVTKEGEDEVLARHAACGSPEISKFAPYVTHILTVEMFLQIALAAHVISTERPSNRVDIAYLFYLPFCALFVSSDRLHERCAGLFMRSDQKFIWGPDLKDDLSRLNEFYSRLPEHVKESGVMSFARTPPADDSFMVTRIWDEFFPRWRESAVEPSERDPEVERKVVAALNEFQRSAQEVDPAVEIDKKEPEGILRELRVARKKGSWYQVRKDLPNRGRES